MPASKNNFLREKYLKIEGENADTTEEAGSTFITGTNVKGFNTIYNSQPGRSNVNENIRRQQLMAQTANPNFSRPKIMQMRINKALTPALNIRQNHSQKFKPNDASNNCITYESQRLS